ncbi:tetratricopeptide repeat protein [Streptosporangium sp. KLBMP 9127]|nr:hypothetical protein [Streptosporangium sp. KLBMP 9127]
MTLPAGRAQPYIGPRPYGWRDRSVFCGRARRMILDIRDKWTASRIVAVYGPAGSGKSSLLHAGIIPAIDVDSVELLPVGRVALGPGAAAPAQGLGNVHACSLLSYWCPKKSAAQLRNLTLTDYLRGVSRPKDKYGDNVTILAAIDQFEELFTAYPSHWKQRGVFLDQLFTALDELPELHVLILLREEHLADLLAYEKDLLKRHYERQRLLPLTRDEAREAIVGPLDGHGRFFATGLDERLATELSTIYYDDSLGSLAPVPTDTVEPMRLQTVCVTCWDQLPGNLRQIEAHHLPRIGEARTDLYAWYRRRTEAAAADLSMPAATLRRWIAAAFVDQGGGARYALRGPAATRGMPNRILTALVHHQVLAAHHHLGCLWYGLNHSLLVAPAQRAAAAEQGVSHPMDRHLLAAEDAWLQGAVEAARHRCELGLDIVPETVAAGDLHALLGLMAEVEGVDDQAARHYRIALGQAEAAGDKFRQSGMLTALGTLAAGVARHDAVGRAQAGSDRYGEAVRLHTRAVELSPDDPTPIRALGACLAEAGRPQEALAAYRRSLAIDPDSFEALLECAKALDAIADYPQALQAAESAAALAPDHVVAKEVRRLQDDLRKRLSRQA